MLVTEAQHAGDEVTAQCLISLMQFQEETIWTLRTSLRRTAFEEQYLSGKPTPTPLAPRPRKSALDHEVAGVLTPSGRRRTK